MNVEAPIDKHGFSVKPALSDKEVIIRCLQNVPTGICPKQAERIAKELGNR